MGDTGSIRSTRSSRSNIYLPDTGTGVILGSDSLDDLGAEVAAMASGPCEITPLDLAGYKKLDLRIQPRDVIPKSVRNKKYNRYLDVLPNPATKVTLPAFGSEDQLEQSAYYNANYVRGANGDSKHFICSMGPLPAVVPNFWRMVWQDKVPLILMATDIVEAGKKKCEPYWPGEQGESLTHGDITITNLKKDVGKVWTESKLEVVKGGEKHNMTHLWFTAWPDHGVPVDEHGKIDASGLVRFVLRARKIVPEPTNPILVHCSAGVGRAGTVIAATHCLELIDRESKVNPIKVVERIRHDRVALVQHKEQFELVHHAVIEYAKMCQREINVREASGSGPDWLHGEYTKEEADAMLTKGVMPDGKYFVCIRDNLYADRPNNDDDYVLCVAFRTHPTQHLISRHPSGNMCVNGTVYGDHKTLEDLIVGLSSPTQGWPVQLLHPVPAPVQEKTRVPGHDEDSDADDDVSRTPKPQRAPEPPAEWQHGVLTEDEAKVLLTSFDKENGTFLVCRRENLFKHRESGPDDYILAVMFKGFCTQHLVTLREDGIFVVNNTQYGSPKSIHQVVEVLRASVRGWPVQLTKHVPVGYTPVVAPAPTQAPTPAAEPTPAPAPEPTPAKVEPTPAKVEPTPPPEPTPAPAPAPAPVTAPAPAPAPAATSTSTSTLPRKSSSRKNSVQIEVTYTSVEQLPSPEGRAEWLHGHYTKEEAEVVLSRGSLPNGKFFVCRRLDLFKHRDVGPDDYILVVAYADSATQHLVTKNEEGYFVVNNTVYGKPPPTTLEMLIETLQQPVPGWPVQLVQPVPRNKPEEPAPVSKKSVRKASTARPEWYHTQKLSKPDADIRLTQAGIEDGKFFFCDRDNLYLDRANKEGDCVLVVGYMNMSTQHLVAKEDNGVFTVNGQPFGNNTSLAALVETLSKPGVPGWPVPLVKPVPESAAAAAAAVVQPPPEAETAPSTSAVAEAARKKSADMQVPIPRTAPSFPPTPLPMWFHGHLDKEEVDELLLEGGPQHGRFLVCLRDGLFKNRANGPYDCVIAVVYRDRPTQHVVSRTSAGVFTVNGKEYGNNQTVEQLVEFLSKSEVTGWPVPLGEFVTSELAVRESKYWEKKRIDDSSNKRGSKRSRLSLFKKKQPDASASNSTASASSSAPPSSSPMWMHGQISREEADAILNAGDKLDGKYFVCKRENLYKTRPNGPEDCVLCVTYQGKGTQHVVSKSPEGLMLVNGMNYGNATTIEELVAVLQRVGIPNWPVQLQYPIPRPEEHETIAEFPWLHGELSREEAHAILLSSADQSNGVFFVCTRQNLFADRPNQPDDYVLCVIYNKLATQHVVSKQENGGPMTVNGQPYGTSQTIEELVEYLSAPSVPNWPVPLTTHIPTKTSVAVQKSRAVSDASTRKPTQLVQPTASTDDVVSVAQLLSQSGRPEWLHGHISREDAHAILLQHPGDGRFFVCQRDNLFRDRPNGPDACVLCVNYLNQPTQHVVSRAPDGTMAVNARTYGANHTLVDLIAKLSQPSVPGWPVRLNKPITGDFTPSRPAAVQAEPQKPQKPLTWREKQQLKRKKQEEEQRQRSEAAAAAAAAAVAAAPATPVLSNEPQQASQVQTDAAAPDAAVPAPDAPADAAAPAPAPDAAAQPEQASDLPPWFHTALSDQQAADLLMKFGVQEGKFLVCPQFKKNKKAAEQYLLWVIYRSRPESYALTKRKDGVVLVNGSAYGENRNVEDVVETLSKPGVSGWPVRLTVGVPVGGAAPVATAAGLRPSPVIRPSWYHSYLTKEESELLVMAGDRQQAEGRFLVCMRRRLYRSRPNGAEDCVLVVVYKGYPTQHIITRWPDGNFAINNQAIDFNASITELIARLKKPNPTFPAVLREPVHRVLPEWFHGKLTHQQADELLVHDGQTSRDGRFLVCTQDPPLGARGNALVVLCAVDQGQPSQHVITRGLDGTLRVEGTPFGDIRTLEELIAFLQTSENWDMPLNEPVVVGEQLPSKKVGPRPRPKAGILGKIGGFSEDEATALLAGDDSDDAIMLESQAAEVAKLAAREQELKRIVETSQDEVSRLERELNVQSRAVFDAQELAQERLAMVEKEQAELRAKIYEQRLDSIKGFLSFDADESQAAILKSSMAPAPAAAGGSLAARFQKMSASSFSGEPGEAEAAQMLAAAYATSMFTVV